MNEYSCLIQTPPLNEGGERPRNRSSSASDATDGRARDQVYVYPASVATTGRAETLTQPQSTAPEHRILLQTGRSLYARACVCGTGGGVKDGEGGSDHILVPADTASCRWNLAGDLKLLTHFP